MISKGLKTPRPIRKVTLKKNRQSQQQQHSSSCTDVPSRGQPMVVKDHWAGAKDSLEISTEATTSLGKLGQNDPDMETDTVVKKEDLTEETNTEAINKLEMGSNKICIRNDLAKKNMIFSQESCQAIIDMGSEELIDMKNSRIQCPSCLHHVFERTIVCLCGKHIKSNKEMIQRIRKAFDILQTPFFRASLPNSRGYKFGSHLTTESSQSS